MQNVYSVSWVNAYVRNMISQDFMLQSLYVKGEASNVKYHSSGHLYFTLKDGQGAMACVMFAGNRSGLKFRLEEGDRIVVFGNVDVYERDGRYQLYAREITHEGTGYLYEKFEKLKRELEEMGMFDPIYKKEIPRFIKRLGVVTAPTGAAVRDIISITKRRNPAVEIILYPAIVQGDEAPASIINGIRALERLSVDVMIVGRGGGSIEDLWAFNEEAVARAVFDCEVPVISAVGHETDTTITDFVADLRAPTPSAAAELVIYDVRQVLEQIYRCKERMIRAALDQIDEARLGMEYLEKRLRVFHPGNQVLQKRQYLTDMEEKLFLGMERVVNEYKHQLQLLAGRLDGLSPLKRLASGFAYVSDEAGCVVDSVKKVNPGDSLAITLRDGTIRAKVQTTK